MDTCVENETHAVFSDIATANEAAPRRIFNEAGTGFEPDQSPKPSLPGPLPHGLEQDRKAGL